MHRPDEPDPPPQTEETWDQWFGRNYGRGGDNRRLKIYAVVMVAAMIALYFSGNSGIFHR